MPLDPEYRSVILVVEDVEETRLGIERLLTASGFEVLTAKDVNEASLKATLKRPDLILLSPGLDAAQAPEASARLRKLVGLGEEIPVVAFCIPNIEEGAEVPAGHNVYLTRPDNFDQLRALLARLLRKFPESR